MDYYYPVKCEFDVSYLWNYQVVSNKTKFN